jgi:LAGLIDADG endonuclease
LAVNDKKSLLYLIKNIFDFYPLLTSNQSARYNLLKHGLINEIKKFSTLEEYDNYKTENLLSNLPQINLIELYKCNKLKIDNWIIGFINGEGSFYLNKDLNKFSFYIEHTDKHVLDLIKYRFDFGPNVLERSIRYRDLDKVRKICYQLNISSKKDIYKLIDFLDNENNISLQGYKLEQYNKWKQKLN